MYDIEAVLSQIDTQLTDDEDLVGDNIIHFTELLTSNFVCFNLRYENAPGVFYYDV